MPVDILLSGGRVLPLCSDGLPPSHAPSPELGELHNQVSLLLLFENKPEEAAHHAQVRVLPHMWGGCRATHFGNGAAYRW